jgi:hypothetical protein
MAWSTVTGALEVKQSNGALEIKRRVAGFGKPTSGRTSQIAEQPNQRVLRVVAPERVHVRVVRGLGVGMEKGQSESREYGFL